MKDLRVTIVQYDPLWLKVIENLAHLETMFSGLKEQTDIILLPEMFATGFITQPGFIHDEHEPLITDFLQKQSAKLKCIIAGTLVSKNSGKYANSLLWMYPDGKREYYVKRHLFRFENENECFVAGDQELILDVNGWKIKPLICYDLRFPVWCRNRYVNGTYEYDLMIFFSNWPDSRMQTWEALLPARAVENQSYVIGVNRTGSDGNNLQYNGGSVVINDRGERLMHSGSKREDIVTVTLSYSLLAEDRQRFTLGPDWDHYTIKY